VGSTTFDARFERSAPELDLATRAQMVFLSISGQPPAAGSAGQLMISSRVDTQHPGTWLPLSALQQGPRGTWQVLTVEQTPNGHQVGLEAVEIQYASEDRVFVIGTLREGQLIIANGTHRVVPGEQVIVADPPLEVTTWQG
jgi:hypothetical protein